VIVTSGKGVENESHVFGADKAVLDIDDCVPITVAVSVNGRKRGAAQTVTLFGGRVVVQAGQDAVFLRMASIRLSKQGTLEAINWLVDSGEEESSHLDGQPFEEILLPLFEAPAAAFFRADRTLVYEECSDDSRNGNETPD
jgi:hypothetical protein